MRADITGWAWRTPLGSDSEEVLRRLLAGSRAARINARFDATSYACTLAACIAAEPGLVRHQRFLRRMGLFAVEVAIEAMASARLQGGPRVGVFFGYGGLRAHWEDMMPAFAQQQGDGGRAWDRGLNLLHPFWMLRHLSNNAHAITAQELRAGGEGTTFGGANAGSQALAAALRALAAGVVDVALVVGYDSLVEPETVVELGARGAASAEGIAHLAAPYDVAAQGFVPGEAAAALVLQRPGEGGPALASLQAADGADGELGEPAVATLARLASGLAQAGDAVDGAGLARRGIDFAERIMMGDLVGPDAPLCCSLSAMGQLGAASSLVQAIAMMLLLQRGALAPIAGLRDSVDGPLRPLYEAESTSCRAAIAIAGGAPGLAGVIRVALP